MEGFRTGGMQDRRDSGQEGVGICGMQSVQNTGQVGCRAGGMQDRRDAGYEGKVGCLTGGLQERRDAR